MVWRSVYKKMEELILEKEFFEASKTFLRFKWADQPFRYQENLVRTVIGYFPYLKKIDQIQIEAIGEETLLTLKNKFIKELLKSSPNNYPTSKKLVKRPEEEKVFYDHIHYLVSKLRHENKLKAMLRSDGEREVVIKHITDIINQRSINKYAPPCKTCTKNYNETFVRNIPKLPVVNCRKKRCYCEYGYSIDRSKKKLTAIERYELRQKEKSTKDFQNQIEINIFGEYIKVPIDEMEKKEITLIKGLRLIFIDESFTFEQSIERSIDLFNNQSQFFIFYSDNGERNYQQIEIDID